MFLWGIWHCLHLEVPVFTCDTAYAPLFDMTDFGSELRRPNQRQWLPGD